MILRAYRKWLCLCIAFSFAAHAQVTTHGCHDATPIGWVPAEILQRPVPLRDGIGKLNEKVTTSSASAQGFYNQGLAYLHSYVFVEAARSFHQALRYDPKLAMAYVGLSRAYSGLADHPAALAMVKKAEMLTESISDRERRRVVLRKLQVESMMEPDSREKQAAYRTALEESLAKELDDPELWLLRGNVEDRFGAGGIGQYGFASSIPFYLHVLKLSPKHFGANHYLIHSNEMVGRIEEALTHGKVFVTSAPVVPHAHHMYGHDLRRVGRTREAIAEFEKADQLERSYFANKRIDPRVDWHHPHNLDLLAASYQHEGQMKKAEEVMRRSQAIDPVSDYRAMNRREWVAFLIARGRVEEALKAAGEMTQLSYPAARSMGHIMAGQAHLSGGHVDKAKEKLAAAEVELGQITGGRAEHLKRFLAPHLERLRGGILLLGDRAPEGRRILIEVQERLRGLPGPDAWIQALFELESIASMARQVGDWELAEFSAKQMLDHDPAYGGAHYAMALVARHKGEASRARRSFLDAAKHWADADRDLSEFARALAEIQTPATAGSQ